MNTNIHIILYLCMSLNLVLLVLTALIFRVSLHDFAALVFPVFCEMFFKLTKFFQLRIILAKRR